MTDLFGNEIDAGAIFSPCRTWRYALWRTWGKPDGTKVAFIGLNPSTADETTDDPTIRRCINFAKLWGFSGLVMLNIFAFRATDPRDMKAAEDPIGPENDAYLSKYALECPRRVAAWGTHGEFKERGNEVARMLPALHCLKANADGSPQHPLYVPAYTALIKWPA